MKRLAILICLVALIAPHPAISQKKPAAQSKTKMKQLKTKLGSVSEQKKALASQIRQTKRQLNYVLADIEKVDDQLTDVENRLEETTNNLQSARQRQNSLAADLRQTLAVLETKKQSAMTRMRQIFVNGTEANVLDLLLSQDLGDLEVRRTMMNSVAKRDRDLFETVKKLKDRVSAAKIEQDQVVAKVSSLVQQQKVHQDTLEDRREFKKGLMGELQGRQAELRKQYDALDRESAALAGQIRALQAAAARRSGGKIPAFRGGLMMPTHGRMSSNFGYRRHPILRERRFHAGVDIAAPTGTRVVAAAPGVVLMAGYTRGYGNRIVIDHGGGLSTLYGHLSRIGVRAGQTIRQGEYIGAVGSTGLSSGPHLHFETRVNGNPVNPLARL